MTVTATVLNLTKVFVFCVSIALASTTSWCGADEQKEVPQAPTAGKDQPRESGKRRDRNDRFKAFKAVDLDHNGSLTFEEFSNMARIAAMEESKRRKLFNHLDRNKDGKIQLNETMSREPRWLGYLRKSFTKIDSDQDGHIDMDEFSKLSHFSDKDQQLIARAFKRIDRNRNGKIERFEVKHPHRRGQPDLDFLKYDTNSSGGLDFHEYSQMPFMVRVPEARRKLLFDRVDHDKSGEISLKEIKGAHRSRHHPRATPSDRNHHKSQGHRKRTKPMEHSPHGLSDEAGSDPKKSIL